MQLYRSDSYIIWWSNFRLLSNQYKSIQTNEHNGSQYQQEYTTNKNSVALIRKRTIPTEWPPLVGEVSTNFSG
jgi:hypothetical protein